MAEKNTELKRPGGYSPAVIAFWALNVIAEIKFPKLRPDGSFVLSARFTTSDPGDCRPSSGLRESVCNRHATATVSIKAEGLSHSSRGQRPRTTAPKSFSPCKGI